MPKLTSLLTPLFLILFCYSNLFAQELVQVTDEILTVNSTSAMTGYTRNKTEITLPEKTKSYIYRISISPKGKSSVNNSLIDLLQNMGGANASIATSFAQFAIKNNDNASVDAFIFNNTYDADNFFAKKDGNWAACKSMPNRVSCCFSTNECIGRKVYFGFKNNNVMQGLDVKLEVVAIVDTSLKVDYKYSYSITNSTNQEVNFMLSLDNINWAKINLRNGYQQIFTFDQKEIAFKIQTSLLKFALYKLVPDERYRIIWNTKLSKWDIERY